MNLAQRHQALKQAGHGSQALSTVTAHQHGKWAFRSVDSAEATSAGGTPQQTRLVCSEMTCRDEQLVALALVDSQTGAETSGMPPNNCEVSLRPVKQPTPSYPGQNQNRDVHLLLSSLCRIWPSEPSNELCNKDLEHECNCISAYGQFPQTKSLFWHKHVECGRRCVTTFLTPAQKDVHQFPLVFCSHVRCGLECALPPCSDTASYRSIRSAIYHGLQSHDQGMLNPTLKITSYLRLLLPAKTLLDIASHDS